MGDIGTERREVEFEPLPEPSREPQRAPAQPAPSGPSPQKTPA